MPTSTITLFTYYSSAIQAIATIVLVLITAVYVWLTRRISWSMSKQTELQMLPAVDVNMIYDQPSATTYFWFSNFSTIPARVRLELKGLKINQSIEPLRIGPRTLCKHTSGYNFGFPTSDPLKEGTEVTLKVSIKPDLSNFDVECKFEKSYRFHNSNWDETTWGYRDLLPLERTSF